MKYAIIKKYGREGYRYCNADDIDRICEIVEEILSGVYEKFYVYLICAKVAYRFRKGASFGDVYGDDAFEILITNDLSEAR